MHPHLYRPTAAADLIGPAAIVCAAYLAEIERNRAAGETPPFKLLLLGKPGVGKSQTAEILAQALARDPMNIERLNGTDLTIDTARQIRSRFGLGVLFGEYQGLWVDELENASAKAQVDLLTLLDKLPPRWFFIGTTNQSLVDFEPRFQTRFEQVVITPPSAEEIGHLLGKWNVPPAIASHIATLCDGNVRAALLDAKQWFTVNHDAIAEAA